MTIYELPKVRKQFPDHGFREEVFAVYQKAGLASALAMVLTFEDSKGKRLKPGKVSEEKSGRREITGRRRLDD